MRKKERRAIDRKILILIFVSILLITILFIGFYFGEKEEPKKAKSPSTTSQTSTPSTPRTPSETRTPSEPRPPPKQIPLTKEELEIIENVIQSSEFVNDIPEKYPISLQFFTFYEGRRIWQKKYLIGKGGIITKGEPQIRLTLHSKYVSEFETNDFCSVIKAANENLDLGFESDQSRTTLMWRYRGLLKHRSCLGLT